MGSSESKIAAAGTGAAVVGLIANQAANHYATTLRGDNMNAAAVRDDGVKFGRGDLKNCENAFELLQELIAKQHPEWVSVANEYVSKTGGYDEVDGGCGCEGGTDDEYSGGGRHRRNYFNGGAPESDPSKALREYEHSLSSKTKEEFIKRIATALAKVGVNVDPNADPDVIVKSLKDNIPNPKNGKSFSDDANAQRKVCETVAKVFNDEFTPGAVRHEDMFIDTSMSSPELCRAIAEWSQSFSHGVNTEFLNVHASVRNALRSVEILNEIMQESFNKIQKLIETDGNPELTKHTDKLHDLFKKAQAERRRQEELLKNILNIHLAPAAKELEIALRDESTNNAMIRRLGLKPGTTEFADSLAYSISGVGTTANIANRVNKALKKVGISVNEYLNSPDQKAFSQLLDEHMYSLKSSDMTAVKNFLTSVEELNKNFKDRNNAEFKSALESASATGGGRYHGGDDYDAEGNYVFRSAIDKRVSQTKTEKRVVIRDFAKRISKHYDDILAAVKALGPELGGKIPLNDSTEQLKDTLVRLMDMRQNKMELSLIGLYAQADSRVKKEQFINRLRQVSMACAHLMTLEAFKSSSNLIAGLKSAIDALEKTVDFYSDIITKKFGGDNDLDNFADDGDDAPVRGGANEDLVPEIARSSITLNEAVSEFAYFYYVANIRENLKRSSEELDVFGEKYVDLLGDAVAMRIWNLKDERAKALKAIPDAAARAAPPGGPAGPWSGLYPPGDANADKRLKMAEEWINQEYDIKEKFYKALQAMDLYMKAFTSGIVKDPDAARDIKKILDGTQVIARWFDEETGNHLSSAFEQMNTVDYDAVVAAGGHYPVLPGREVPIAILGDNNQARPHYFDKAGAAVGAAAGPAANSLPGHPFASVPFNEADANNLPKKARKHVSDTIDHFQALKNLVNAFSRIGDNFGGKEIKTQIFMSPSQIYKYLIDFLKMSSLSMVKRVGDEIPAPVHFATAHPDGKVFNAAPGAPGAPPAPFGTQYTAETPNAQFQVNFSAIDQRTNPDMEYKLNNYTIENRYFILILKAMAAKIMTTIGVYDMFERKSPLYELTPTRLIIGGGYDDVEIIEGAAELYFRLPRLVEFYKMIFFRDNPVDNTQIKIAMIPELEGVFSGLIRIIFLKATGANEGEYADSELRKMITEINAIYNHFKGSAGEDKCVKASMNALVKEINRRYAVIKNKDMYEYWNLTRREKSLAEGDYNKTDYAILPGEGDDVTERMAPSDRFASTLGLNFNDPNRGATPREFNGRTPLDPNINDPQSRRMLVREFRSKIELEFSKVRDNFGKTSYTQLINRSREKIKKAANLSEKTTAAMELINNSSVVGVDANRALMFHETVVVGLNTLMAVSNFITDFENALFDLDAHQLELSIQDAINYAIENAAGLPLTDISELMDASGQLHRDNAALPLISSRNLNDGRQSRFIIKAAAARHETIIRRNQIANNVLNNDVYVYLNRVVVAIRPVGADRITVYPSKITPVDIQVNSNLADRGRCYGNILLASRLLVDYPKLMEEYIETIFNINQESGGMIDVKFMSGDNPTAIHINGSKLKDFIETTLNEVKYYMDMFRSSLPKDVIDRFEKIENPGSIYWLEKNLIDKRLKGISEDNMDDQTKTLDFMFKKANSIFKYYIATDKTPIVKSDGTRYSHAEFDAGGLLYTDFAGHVFADDGRQNNSKYETYGNSLASLLWYDSQRNNSGFYNRNDLFVIDGPRIIERTINRTLRINNRGVGDITVARDDATLLNRLVYIKRAARDAARVPADLPQDATFNLHLFMDKYTEVDANFARMGSALTKHKSLLFLFNQLVYKYLSEFVDSNGDKIYTKLIDAYTNGVAARSVNGPIGSSFPDLFSQGGDVGRLNDPKQNIVLCETLSWVLQRLSKDVNPSNQISDHLVSTLIDIPSYMKENYRVKLPNFVKQFNIILQKGEFIRQLMQKTKINCSRRMTGVANTVRLNNAFVSEINRITVLRQPALYGGFADMTNDDMKTRVSEIIDSITSHAYAISSCAGDVLREITDDPIYLQTQEKSIETYKLRYGKLPLMPFSASLIALSAGTNMERYNFLFPNKAIGSNDFKFQYGIRGLLIQNEPVTYDKIPGTQMIVQNYNNSSTKREQIDTERYLKFIQTLTTGIRYLVDTTCFKTGQSVYYTNFGQMSYTNEYPGFTPQRGPGRFLPNAHDGDNMVKRNMMLPYTISCSYNNRRDPQTGLWNPPDIQKVISMVETSNQDDEVVKIIKYIDDKSGNNSRDRERILNLVDMNIIPINVHALMRDVPLANLYNYEYTFDQMIVSLYGEQMSTYFGNNGGPSPPGPPNGQNGYKRTKEMFLKLMTDPYYHIKPDQKNYYGSDVFELGSAGFVHRMFRGDNDLGLGRPKFLFDQLFNKSLFGNAYASESDYDEAGPGVGAGVRRGREQVGSTVIVTQAHIDQFNKFTELLIKLKKSFDLMKNTLNIIIDREIQGAIDDPNGGGAFAGHLIRNSGDYYYRNYRGATGDIYYTHIDNYFANIAPAGPPKLVNAHAEITGIHAILQDDLLNLINWIYRIYHLADPAIVGHILLDDRLVTMLAGLINTSTDGVYVTELGIGCIHEDRPGGNPLINHFRVTADLNIDLGFGPIRRPANANTNQVIFDLLDGSYGNANVDEYNGKFGRDNGNMKALLRFHQTYKAFLTNPDQISLPGSQQVEIIFNNSTTLTYLDKPEANHPDHTAVKVVEVGSAVKRRQLEAIGRARFDTTLVRNLFFITNILRVVRLKLNRELTQSRNVIVKSHEAVAQGLTEYGADPFSPNEVYDSTLPNGYARYNDADEI
jgi:hypothetical protein